jgi:hypothetical protein
MSEVYNKVTMFMYKDWNKYYADAPDKPKHWPTQEEWVEANLQKMSRKEFLEAISNAIDSILDERIKRR